MTDLIFNPTVFRAQFPAFSCETGYPTALLQMYWDTATCFISASDCPCQALNGGCRELALNYMTAHLLALNNMVKEGQTPGMVSSSTIDKISVTLTTPPQPNQWQWWLNLTPYGMQLLALLQLKTVGGWYIGGRPETAGFRKVGGVF
jgi:hypothetical protein